MEQDVQQILEEALAEGQNVLIEGKVASYIPELAKADSSNLGCCIMNADGSMYKAGDYNIPFTMQSIAKTFSHCRLRAMTTPSRRWAWSRPATALTAYSSSS